MTEFKGAKAEAPETGAKKLSSKIWEKIEDAKMKPVAKWRWQIKELMNWGIFFLSVLLGSISFGVILLELFSTDWNLYKHLTDSFTEYLFGVLPYFWILFLVAMLGIAYYRFFHTKGGYRYSGLRILIYSLALSILFGFALYFINMSSWVYDLTHEFIPRPAAYKINRYDMWNQPEEGLLAGRLVELLNQHEATLVDFEEAEWVVNFEEAKIYDMKSVRLGEIIKILGEQLGEHEFKAFEVRPWKENILHMGPPMAPGLPKLLPMK